MAKGAAIGVAMIIPGVSGGTLAVLLDVYDRIIRAISNIFKDFKNSILVLLPILLGAVIAVAAAYFPIKYALRSFPFPTVMLFAGLMIGSCPKIVKDGIKRGFKWLDILSVALPLILVIGICFIPSVGSANLGADMPVHGYFLLIAIGALASCALVVPGISGSMLLLIFGYYNEILDTVSLLRTDFGHSVLVLALFAVGIIIGFFSIARLMKFLLSKFPKATNWAIIGFVIGSIPAIFITYNANFPDFVYGDLNAVHIAVGCVLCSVGIVATLLLTVFAEKKSKKMQEITENTDNNDKAETE